MERINKYEILIDFKNSSKANLYNGNIDYLGTKRYKDHIVITENKITISCYRSAKIDLSSVFYNHNSSLYNQIVKSLAYYYARLEKFVEITKITVSHSKNGKLETKKKLEKEDINQIINPKFKFKYSFQQEKLEVILSESEKGKNILNSITYLIKANNSVDAYEKFERLWKSFNPLYRQIGQQRTEFDNLVQTRTFIINNATDFANSLPKVSELSPEEFRNPLRWRAMILNNHPTQNDTNSFRASITRYSDYRIMNAYLDTIGNREQFLKNLGYYNEVINHINNHIEHTTKIDIELICILTLRYMYFIRNKSFHGEKMDSTFRITINKELKEFEWLNDKLEPFIFDLINSNDKF
ncbi:hypothetical protein [Flavobacterium sp.]|uniref:hypothetical protein n=1 Tax=Flavobacterium sp. TaxID=239 RepID=UPI0008B0EA4F|nr:hypothetical protein [Flavobacterium sp.]OGS60256.1 MAG: hypothetical protein A2X07_03420 [Flavobacteria bacterium GWF1_32_7]HBD25562.1 hypothetical protein [Flavobacterium sp.]